MYREISIIFFMFVNIISVFSVDEFSYRGDTNSIFFTDNTVTINKYNWEERNYSTSKMGYEIIYEDEIPFLLLSEGDSRKWLFLRSKYFSIIFEDSKKDFFNGIGYSNNFDNIRNAKYEIFFLFN